MNNILPLFLTFIAGLFIAFGALIVYITKNNDKFVHFAISMAFGVMVTLIGFELLPEVNEVFNDCFNGYMSYVILVICVLFGVGILKVLDLFVPDHEHHNTTKKAELDNLYHIGIVASVALMLHNLIEGMSIYGVSSTSLEMGMMMTLGVGFHNIPMGIMITSMFERSNDKKKSKFVIMLSCVTLSTLFGGFMMLILSSFISDLFIGVLLGLTLGMLLYILLFELLPEIIESKDKKLSMLGILVGICIFSISMLLG